MTTGGGPAIVAYLEQHGTADARELARACRMSMTTCWRHLKSLRAEGRVFRQGGQPCLYALDPARFWDAPLRGGAASP